MSYIMIDLNQLDAVQRSEINRIEKEIPSAITKGSMKEAYYLARLREVGTHLYPHELERASNAVILTCMRESNLSDEFLKYKLDSMQQILEYDKIEELIEVCRYPDNYLVHDDGEYTQHENDIITIVMRDGEVTGAFCNEYGLDLGLLRTLRGEW